MKKELFLKLVKFNSFNKVKAVSIIFVFFMILSLSSARIFAAETDRDFTLDDGSGDSPQVILNDTTIEKRAMKQIQTKNVTGVVNLDQI